MTNPNDVLTLHEVAEMLNVSATSIRNWVKLGYLEKAGNNGISYDSLTTFKRDILGKEKLTQRANKSCKDSHNHEWLKQQILHEVQGQKPGDDSLSHRYEGGLSQSHKNQEGIFYTPPEVVKRFFDYLPDDCSSFVFCDPCCGTGNFLIEAIKRGVKPSNIYGYDIDEIAVAIARQRLATVEGGHEVNLAVQDFLNLAAEDPKPQFDIILTNPPWGKKLPKAERDDWALKFAAGTSKDSSALFFFASLRVLRSSGYLGFLVQEAFFNIASFESARQIALKQQIISLIDFGKPFKGLVTQAHGIVLRRESPQAGDRLLSITAKGEHSLPQYAFSQNPKSIFNFTCSEQDLRVIEHLFKQDHQTLAGSAKWGLGIVTGNNQKYCASEMKEGYIPVYKGSDISKSGLKSPSCFIPEDFSNYQQVAPLSLYQAPEKLIYKFITSKLAFFYDTEQRFILNSANLLVLKDEFPLSPQQLAELLNSRLMSWLFQKLFRTRKVLRQDLESLPIFVSYFERYQRFCEQDLLEFLYLREVPSGTYRVIDANR
ncbi:methyltransferase domain-containing protein [Geitlerinema sp. P-1104]|uniref:TaqI-like C-terminal specificity domain-containing protein n=1 Tax=Geitlerinema sp. P-1104 TaxID=2546230 RepID=UPI00147689BE|nr:methyltransferase domain-containing protein [Geitlerinema sp. P-1104]